MMTRCAAKCWRALSLARANSCDVAAAGVQSPWEGRRAMWLMSKICQTGTFASRWNARTTSTVAGSPRFTVRIAYLEPCCWPSRAKWMVIPARCAAASNSASFSGAIARRPRPNSRVTRSVTRLAALSASSLRRTKVSARIGRPRAPLVRPSSQQSTCSTSWIRPDRGGPRRRNRSLCATAPAFQEGCAAALMLKTAEPL